MITFLVCLALLVAAYFIYGKYLERVVGMDPIRACPSKTLYDGVDYVPLPRWKTFLIQLLNIAGVGPIFGAILGAAYGPVAFLWITLGGIFFGAMHDYVSGMISLQNDGLSLPEIVGKYLGLSVKQVMRVFTILLLLLVGAVFLTSPATLLGNLTGIGSGIWIWVILAYYVVATMLPIDKIISKIYPVFGAAILFMAVGIFLVLLFGDYHIPEFTTLKNFKTNPERFPIIPTMFITIACGAISGFHATQSPLMARCMNNQKEGRPVFFGAMISESVIALVWAAMAMAFFGGAQGLNGAIDAWSAAGQDPAPMAVNDIAFKTLGAVGGILALLGVIAAPISTGDTAFRSARLIVADFLKIEQKSILKRLYICVPLFAAGYFIAAMKFEVIWRYFAWANQTLAVFTLWAITVYLWQKRKNVYISLIPALAMTFITSDFMFTAKQMFGLGQTAGTLLAGVLTLIIFAAVLLLMRKEKR